MKGRLHFYDASTKYDVVNDEYKILHKIAT